MKWLGGVAVLIVLIFVSIMIFRAKSPLDVVENYRIYYGRMNEAILEEMKAYDMVVVEALRFDKAMVNELHEAGVMVIGYISISEVGWWDEEIVSQLENDHYLREGGKQLTNGKNKLGDLSTLQYRTVLLNTIDSRIIGKGMDGLFFDTVDTFDIIENDELKLSQVKGYVHLIEDIRLAWKDTILIQNRGFNYVDHLERGMVNGLLWENFSEDLLNDRVYKERADKLWRMKWLKGIKPIVLSYKDEEGSRKSAVKHNWLFSFLSGQEGLTEWNMSGD